MNVGIDTIKKLYKGMVYYSITFNSLIERTNKYFFTRIINYKYFNLFGKDIKIVKNAIIPKKYYDNSFSDEVFEFLKNKGTCLKNIYFDNNFEIIDEETYLREELNPSGLIYKNNTNNNNDVEFYNKYFKYQVVVLNGITLGPIKEAIDLFLMGATDFINYKSDEANIILIKNKKEEYYVAKTKYGLFECNIGAIVRFGDVGFNPKCIYDDVMTKNFGWITMMLEFFDSEIIEFKKGEETYRVYYNPKENNQIYPKDLYELTYGSTFSIYKKDSIIGNKLTIPDEEYFKKSRGTYMINTLEDSLWRAQEIIDDFNK